MTTLHNLSIILLFVTTPALLIYLSNKYSILGKIGAVMLAYAFGILISVSGLLPENFEPVQNTMSEIAIPLALPMLLFSLNVKQWFKIAGKTFLSMILGIVSLLIVLIAGYMLFAKPLPESEKVAGMLVGVYTGGTPNLVALKTALQVTNETYILTHTFDTLWGVLYLFFLLSIARRIFSIVLPKYIFLNPNLQNNDSLKSEFEDYSEILSQKYLPGIMAAFGISVFIMAVGGGISMLFPKSVATAIAILLITTGGILFSLHPKINAIKKSFQAGMYFILIFCIVVASMLNLDKLITASPLLVFYIGLAIFGTLFLHVLLSSIFKIDTDTTIITSTALCCSPPFVPVVAGALKNKEIIISGITVGIIGYAIGNYLGVSLAWLLPYL